MVSIICYYIDHTLYLYYVYTLYRIKGHRRKKSNISVVYICLLALLLCFIAQVLLQKIIDNNVQLKEKGQSIGSDTSTALVAVSSSPEQQTSKEEESISEEVENDAAVTPSSSAATAEENQPLAEVVTSLGKRAREPCASRVTPAATTTTSTDVASKRRHSNVVAHTTSDIHSNRSNNDVDRSSPTAAPASATAQDADLTVAHIKLESAMANPNKHTQPVDTLNDGVLQGIAKQTSAGTVHIPSLPRQQVPPLPPLPPPPAAAGVAAGAAAAGARARAAFKGSNAYTTSELARLQELIPRFSAASTMGKNKMCKELTAEFVSRKEKGLMCKLYYLMKLEKERHTAVVAAQERTHDVCNKPSNMSKPLKEYCMTSSSYDDEENLDISSHEDRSDERCTTGGTHHRHYNNNSSSCGSSRDEEADSDSLVSVSSISATLISITDSTPSATLTPTTDWQRTGTIKVRGELLKDYGLDEAIMYYETDHTHCSSCGSSDEDSEQESLCMEETEEWEVSEVVGSEATSEPHPAVTTVHITTVTPTTTATARTAVATTATPAAATTATAAATTIATPAVATTTTPAATTTATPVVATTTTPAAIATATPAAIATATAAAITTTTPAATTTTTPAVATTATPAAAATTTTTSSTNRTFCVNAITSSKQQYVGDRTVHTTYNHFHTFSIKQNLSIDAYMRKYGCTRVEAVDALRRKAFERGYII